ncbi:hypothetical protein KCU65_g10048, partial [Aureobasidium melanogenum]
MDCPYCPYLVEYTRFGKLDLLSDEQIKKRKSIREICKTYSSRDSHVVTHRSTNLPFNCLCMAERTGCPVFS